MKHSFFFSLACTLCLFSGARAEEVTKSTNTNSNSIPKSTKTDDSNSHNPENIQKPRDLAQQTGRVPIGGSWSVGSTPGESALQAARMSRTEAISKCREELGIHQSWNPVTNRPHNIQPWEERTWDNCMTDKRGSFGFSADAYSGRVLGSAVLGLVLAVFFY